MLTGCVALHTTWPQPRKRRYLIQDITRGTRYTLLVACMLINETQIVGQVEMGIQLTTTTSLVVGWIKG